jgi:hypothetical protein
MFLLYSLGFNADPLSEEYCVYGKLDNCAELSLRMPVLQQISLCYENEWLPSVLNILSPVIVGSYKHSGCCVCVICCFQHQVTAIRTLRNVGVTRNCFVRDFYNVQGRRFI